MIVLLILCFGLVTVILGRMLFDQWFNHITLYSAIWTVSLVLFHLGYIYYYPLESGTWILILDAWVAFLLGACIVVAARYCFSDAIRLRRGKTPATAIDIRFVHPILWALNIIALLTVIQHWHLLIQQFGSVRNVIISGNLLYSHRVKEGLPGSIPYFDAFALSGSWLAGLVTSRTGKLRFVALMPILIMVLDAVSGMGRASLLIATILFAAGYFPDRLMSHSFLRKQAGRWKRFFVIAFAMVIFIAAAEYIRSNRGTIENIDTASSSLSKYRSGYLITPSIYAYLTIHTGIFNQYLKHDEERAFFAANTLAPINRVLAKFGFDTYVPDYPPFYNTPASANTGTYLRDLHLDFGVPGILLAPFFLGMMCSWLVLKNRESGSFRASALLAHMYVVVLLSFFVEATRLGYWLVSLLGALAAAWYLDNRKRTAARQAAIPGLAAPLPPGGK